MVVETVFLDQKVASDAVAVAHHFVAACHEVLCGKEVVCHGIGDKTYETTLYIGRVACNAILGQRFICRIFAGLRLLGGIPFAISTYAIPPFVVAHEAKCLGRTWQSLEIKRYAVLTARHVSTLISDSVTFVCKQTDGQRVQSGQFARGACREMKFCIYLAQNNLFQRQPARFGKDECRAHDLCPMITIEGEIHFRGSSNGRQC